MKSRGHGREETREVLFAAPAAQTNSGDWRGLATIGLVKLTTLRAGKITEQVRYFISSLPLGMRTFACAIRSHWRIENSCHWVLDVSYREDESRMREKSARENFAWLYRFTRSILKHHPSKHSLAMKRRACGWNIDFLTEVATGITSYCALALHFACSPTSTATTVSCPKQARSQRVIVPAFRKGTCSAEEHTE